jgi:hypothetical protein
VTRCVLGIWPHAGRPHFRAKGEEMGVPHRLDQGGYTDIWQGTCREVRGYSCRGGAGAFAPLARLLFGSFVRERSLLLRGLLEAPNRLLRRDRRAVRSSVSSPPRPRARGFAGCLARPGRRISDCLPRARLPRLVTILTPSEPLRAPRRGRTAVADAGAPPRSWAVRVDAPYVSQANEKTHCGGSRFG